MLAPILEAVRRASAEILLIRNAGFATETKADQSPVTAADLASSAIIGDALQKHFPSIPVIDEERLSEASLASGEFFLVDPLDGTKEFVAGRADFTVNIALIRNGRPVLGVVGTPLQKELVFAEDGKGAFRERDQQTTRLHAGGPPDRLRVVCSRSHQDPFEKRWIESLSTLFQSVELSERGSSLKILAIAAGEADFYPRLGRTCEWDIAAAHCILVEAGGALISLQNLQELTYGKPAFYNPGFVAVRSDLLTKTLQARPEGS